MMRLKFWFPFLAPRMEGPLLPSYSNLENLKVRRAAFVCCFLLCRPVWAIPSLFFCTRAPFSSHEHHSCCPTQVLDLGLNSLSGAVPASWAEGMASLQWLALDSNPSLCGSLPSTWTSGPAAISILTFNTALGTRCSSLGASSHSSLKPVTTDIVAVMSATFVWPGGDLTDLKVNGGLAEQEFRQRFRRYAWLCCESRSDSVCLCFASAARYCQFVGQSLLVQWFEGVAASTH